MPGGAAQASDDALALLGSLMAFDPSCRPTAAEALKHRYFRMAPQPTEAARLPKPPVRAHNPLKPLPEVSHLQPQPSLAEGSRTAASEE